MAYAECKIYSDGSHYIAIPHTTRPSKKRYKPPEEKVEVIENEDVKETTEAPKAPENDIENECTSSEETEGVHFDDIQETEELTEEPKEKPKKKRTATRKEIFEEIYKETIGMKRSQRKRTILERMKPYFERETTLQTFVEVNLERKYRNLICRRVRMVRKANLQDFNYFCTFTYDSKLHTEASFKKDLKNTLSNFAKRKGWKYMGVWERSPEKKRLHFHGIFYIPENTMPGMIIQVNDYSFKTHKRQITDQNTYFNERFGRSDFEEINEPSRMGEAMAYLMKYLEKTGEKIIYSKGMPQYFISDILDDDVVCTIGQEDKKLLLFDNFNCIDNGEYIGQVCPEVIAKMRKSN